MKHFFLILSFFILSQSFSAFAQTQSISYKIATFTFSCKTAYNGEEVWYDSNRHLLIRDIYRRFGDQTIILPLNPQEEDNWRTQCVSSGNSQPRGLTVHIALIGSSLESHSNERLAVSSDSITFKCAYAQNGEEQWYNSNFKEIMHGLERKYGTNIVIQPATLEELQKWNTACVDGSDIQHPVGLTVKLNIIHLNHLFAIDEAFIPIKYDVR